MVVDLPAPLRPSRAVAWPAYAWTSMPATASTSPKRTCRPRTSTTGSLTRKVSQRSREFAWERRESPRCSTVEATESAAVAGRPDHPRDEHVQDRGRREEHGEGHRHRPHRLAVEG